jgi:hypothetical protein
MAPIIHDDISLPHFVIPGLTRNPVFFWIPAFAGMTAFAMTNIFVYKLNKVNLKRRLPHLIFKGGAGRHQAIQERRISNDKQNK